MICIKEDCGRKAVGQGFCAKHYREERNKGMPLLNGKSTECKISGCSKPYRAKGLCSTHYKDLWKDKIKKDKCVVNDCDRDNVVTPLSPFLH